MNANPILMEHINEFLSTTVVQELMQAHSPSKSIQVISIERFSMDNSASILVTLTTGQTDRLIGHFGLAVTYLENGILKTQNMVMKIKPHGSVITSMLNGLAQAVGGELAPIYSEHKERTGFAYTHLREQEIYTKLPSSITPKIFGTLSDPENERYIILMEYLQEVELINEVMAPEKFSDQHIKAALSQIATWHAQNFGHDLRLDKKIWSDRPSSKNMEALKPLWKALLSNAATHFPSLYNKEYVDLLNQAIINIPNYWKELDRLPKTLVHNDFNPRNICFKKENGELKLCAYDWELATFHIPQYDVVEFLCFVLDKDRYHLREEYLEYYRLALKQHLPSVSNTNKFKREFDWAALDFGLHRLGMYMMAHTLSPYPFLPRVVESFFDTLKQSELQFLKRGAYPHEPRELKAMEYKA
jgi:Ecdysteroid kinase-like family